MQDFIDWFHEVFLYFVVVVIASIISYANKLSAGKTTFSFLGGLVHFITSVFFGWIIGQMAFYAGYTEPGQIMIAASMGSYLGDKVIDLFYQILKVDRRK